MLMDAIIRRRRLARFSPAALFGPTDTGWLYDLSDMSTLFQDAAGTTPVTAVGQPVGLFLDKSGRGNHRSQSVSLNRPTYARHPLGGIRNLWTHTEQFDNAAWIKSNATITQNAATDPNGVMTADKLVENTASNLHIVLQDITTAGQSITVSVYAKAAERSAVHIRNGNLGVSSVFDVSGGTVISQGVGQIASISDAGDGWFRCSVNITSAVGAQQILIGAAIGATISYTGDGSSGLFLWGAQVEAAASATAYQRVGSVFDVTEAGVPDLYYLSYDGLNDSLSTAPFAWGSDKATICAGVRKLADPPGSNVVEFSPNVLANTGSFLLAAPATTLSVLRSYLLASRGTINQNAFPAGNSLPAPHSAVLTAIANISGDRGTLRVNGIQVAQSTGDQGTGNFGTHAAFFGARADTSLPFNGREYSQFAINRLLTANELSQIERYTAQRTGVTLP